MVFAKEANAHIIGVINWFSIDLHNAIGDAEDEFTHYDPLNVYYVGNLLCGFQNHAGKFYVAHANGAPAALSACPTQVKPDKLPHGVEPQTAGHYGIVFKMAFEKPEVGLDIQFGDNLAFSFGAAIIIDRDNAIHHEHRGQGELGVSWSKHVAMCAGQQVFVAETALFCIGHAAPSLLIRLDISVTGRHRILATSTTP
ncbi:MAG: hypothetical protein ACJAU6_000346 [Alphaproteobacteria bacterium]